MRTRDDAGRRGTTRGQAPLLSCPTSSTRAQGDIQEGLPLPLLTPPPPLTRKRARKYRTMRGQAPLLSHPSRPRANGGLCRGPLPHSRARKRARTPCARAGVARGRRYHETPSPPPPPASPRPRQGKQGGIGSRSHTRGAAASATVGERGGRQYPRPLAYPGAREGGGGGSGGERGLTVPRPFVYPSAGEGGGGGGRAHGGEVPPPPSRPPLATPCRHLAARRSHPDRHASHRAPTLCKSRRLATPHHHGTQVPAPPRHHAALLPRHAATLGHRSAQVPPPTTTPHTAPPPWDTQTRCASPAASPRLATPRRATTVRKSPPAPPYHGAVARGLVS